MIDASLPERPQGLVGDGTRVLQPTGIQAQTLDDAHGIVADARFVDLQEGDFRVKAGSPALQLGSENFPMTGFGVTSAHLNALAPEPEIVVAGRFFDNTVKKAPQGAFLGAEVNDLDTESELTACGAPSKGGVILVGVPAGSPMERFGFESDDVIINVNSQQVHKREDLQRMMLKKGSCEVRVVRGQTETTVRFEYE